MTQFQVYGLQRSGTNWSRKFITQNTNLNYYPHGKNCPREDWKHTITKTNFNPKIQYFYIYKNPNQWVESIVRNCEDLPYTQPLGTEFGPKLNISYRKNSFKMEISLGQLCSLYTKHIQNWFEYSKSISNLKIIYYNKLLTQPEIVLKEWIVKKPKNECKLSERAIQTNHQREFTPQTLNYYTQNKTEFLTSEHIKFISDNILKTIKPLIPLI